MWLQSFQRVLHQNDNLEASWWCIQRSREDTDAPKQIPRDIKCAGVHPHDKCRKISKEIHCIERQGNFYWSLEKNDLHVWILFGFCPSPPTKKLKEMEEKYQPHPCSAQTGSTQDINWNLFFPSTHFFSDDKPACPMSNGGLYHHCSIHCLHSQGPHSFKVFVKQSDAHHFFLD